MSKLIVVIFVFFQVIHSNGLSKHWMSTFEFKDPNNWVTTHLPCPTEQIILPRYLFTTLSLPERLESEGIVLPARGAILLQEDSHILISSPTNEPTTNPNLDKSCKNIKSQDTFFKRPNAEPWFAIKNWQIISADGNDINGNVAVPHQDLIPCRNDDVIFPSNNFAIDLQYFPKITVKSISFESSSQLEGWGAAGVNIISLTKFQNSFRTEIGQMMFHNSETTTVDYEECHEKNCDCHGAAMEQVMDQLCENERQSCETPLCVDPIKPVGHCCSICGAIMMMDLTQNEKFNLLQFRERIKKKIEGENLSTNDDVHFYAGVVVKNDQTCLQLVIRDVKEYNEQSVNAMDILKSTILQQLYKDKQLTFHYSGRFYNPSASGHFWLYFFLPLLTVLMLFFILHVQYYQDTSKIRFPISSWTNRITSFLPSFQSPLIFARYENFSGDEDSQSIITNIEIKTEPLSSRGGDGMASQRNLSEGEPIEMYDSSAGTSGVVTSQLEKQPNEEINLIETIAADEKLVDVELE